MVIIPLPVKWHSRTVKWVYDVTIFLQNRNFSHLQMSQMKVGQQLLWKILRFFPESESPFCWLDDELFSFKSASNLAKSASNFRICLSTWNKLRSALVDIKSGSKCRAKCGLRNKSNPNVRNQSVGLLFRNGSCYYPQINMNHCSVPKIIAFQFQKDLLD